jgi:hypothetical protein
MGKVQLLYGINYWSWHRLVVIKQYELFLQSKTRVSALPVFTISLPIPGK